MKLELDFRNKVITVDDTVNFKELHKVIKELLNKDWKDWDIQGQAYNYNTYPVFPTYELFDWSDGSTITCGGNITTCLLNNTTGTVTIETE